MRIPTYRKHSTRDVGFTEFRGKRHYFPGRYKSPQSDAAYRDFLAQNLFARSADDASPPSEISISSIVLAYLIHAEAYYGRGKDSEFINVRGVLLAFANACGSVAAVEFGPKALKAYRETLIAAGKNSRGHINWKIARIKRCFRWAASEEMYPGSMLQSLLAVPGIREGRQGVRESAKRQPVPWEHVEPILDCLSPALRAMLLLQSYTGARSGSVCRAKVQQFRRRGALLDWRPRHKTEKRAKLILPIGPKCQAVLLQFFGPVAGGYLFRPRDASNHPRYGKRYTSRSYRQAILRAIKRANATRGPDDQIPAWCPHQIRHAKASEVRERFGVEAAQSVLGHESLKATEIYSARRLKIARRIAKELG